MKQPFSMASGRSVEVRIHTAGKGRQGRSFLSPAGTGAYLSILLRPKLPAEEAVAVGACAALNERDYIGSNHRGHGHLVARGADMGRMMAEILGKEDGYSKGKGGSMHIMAMDLGILGANGIVGGEIPIATGAGYSAKYRGTDQVTLCFFGDGASNEGTFHESINMAAAWDLPVIYIIENI